MNQINEQSAGDSTKKPAFQSQSLGPNKVASTDTPPETTPDVVQPDPTPDPKPDVKPIDPPIIPIVANHVTTKPQMEKQS